MTIGPPVLPFSNPTIEYAADVRALTRHGRASDQAFVNIYLLEEKYGTTVAIKHNCLFRHFSGQDRLRGYAFPCTCETTSLRNALEAIRDDAYARKRPLQFCLLTSEQLAAVRQFLPGNWEVHSDRGDADYLYRRDELAELRGNAFHGKRNHISKFLREHPGKLHFLSLSRETAQDALHVAQEWLSDRELTPALAYEARALHNALQAVEELELFGTVLYADGQPIGMSVGSMISPEVADIHYEKCTPPYRGAYPLLTQEVARQLPSDCEYINREEDLNQPGLRQAKLSFYPCEIIEKYSATLNPSQENLQS